MREDMSKIRIRLYCICFLALISACDGENTVALEAVEVNFSDTTLRIPKNYILGELPTSLVERENPDEQLDHVSLKIPLSELNIESVKGVTLSSNIILSLGNISNGNYPEDVNNAKKQVGLYENALIEKDPLLDFHRVYSRSGYPKLWHYFKTDLNEVDASSEWVGSCMVGPLENEKYDLSNVKCNAKSSYKDIVFQFTTNAKYFSDKFDLKNSIADKLRQWEVSKKNNGSEPTHQPTRSPIEPTGGRS